MPSSAVHTFTDADDYAAAIRAATIEMIVTRRGQFTAKHIRIDFHRLWMQRLSENLPRVLHMMADSGRAGITFRTQPGPSLMWSGVEMRVDHITRHSEGHDAYQLSSGPACFAAMSLPVEDIASIGATMTGCDLSPPAIREPSPLHRAQWLNFSGCMQRSGIWRKTPRKSSLIPIPRAGWSKRS